MNNMKNLRDLTYEDMLAEVAAMGEKPYRAAQIFSWVFGKGALSIDEMTDISKPFREALKEGFFIGAIAVMDSQRASDGTRKFLSELSDGGRIESVIIPEPGRLTLCVSTQAGCAMGCAFCMTGKSGFVRNLTLSELTGQVFAARGLLDQGEVITNIVLMGMGEPLANYDSVISFVRVLTDGKGFGLSHNKITVSTAGLVPLIKRLGDENGVNINLAVSLNATTDEVRTRIMPVNRKYPIAALIKALEEYPLRGSKKMITIEYVLIKGLNDSIADARRLVRLLARIKCKINLIPFNAFPGSGMERPSDDAVAAFADVLMKAGFLAIVRSSKGADIQAACGQLRGRYSPDAQNGPAHQGA